MRSIALALILPAALAGCALGEDNPDLAAASGASAPQATGPAADYPVVIGEPYRVGETLYTPADILNYDEVGYLAADGGQGVSASHHTLPLPSYAEVTSLATGRTILVRIERRGPLDSDALIALSAAALDHLGAGAGQPVRVRRVNPPEEERALLRAGRPSPPRMDTPEGLLTVLKRKLPQNSYAGPTPVARPAAVAQVELSPSSVHAKSPPAVPTAEAHPPEEQQPSQSPGAAAPAAGAYVVQALALSSRENAQRVASAIDGSVTQAGKFYRVRTGPFATRSEAEASLAKVQAAGYSDARIFTND